MDEKDQNPPLHRVVIGIDFGTTYTGVAYPPSSLTADVSKMTTWGDNVASVDFGEGEGGGEKKFHAEVLPQYRLEKCKKFHADVDPSGVACLRREATCLPFLRDLGRSLFMPLDEADEFDVCEERGGMIDAPRRGTLSQGRPFVEDPIAIVGMGCQFSPPMDVDGFWLVLAEREDTADRVPKDRFDLEWSDHTWMHFGNNEFDSRFFNTAPREFSAMGPQERLALESAYEAFEQAGFHLESNDTSPERIKYPIDLHESVDTAQDPPMAYTELKRRRRRESHNTTERRRRDNINERIQELGKLVPQHRLEKCKVDTLLEPEWLRADTAAALPRYVNDQAWSKTFQENCIERRSVDQRADLAGRNRTSSDIAGPKLGAFDVACLMINKQIGTGIFVGALKISTLLATMGTILATASFPEPLYASISIGCWILPAILSFALSPCFQAIYPLLKLLRLVLLDCILIPGFFSSESMAKRTIWDFSRQAFCTLPPTWLVHFLLWVGNVVAPCGDESIKGSDLARSTMISWSLNMRSQHARSVLQRQLDRFRRQLRSVLGFVTGSHPHKGHRDQWRHTQQKSAAWRTSILF